MFNVKKKENNEKRFRKEKSNKSKIKKFGFIQCECFKLMKIRDI